MTCSRAGYLRPILPRVSAINLSPLPSHLIYYPTLDCARPVWCIGGVLRYFLDSRAIWLMDATRYSCIISSTHLIALVSAVSMCRFCVILSLCSLSLFSRCSAVSEDLRRAEHSLACLNLLSLLSSDSPASLDDFLAVGSWSRLVAGLWTSPGSVKAAHPSRNSVSKSASVMATYLCLCAHRSACIKAYR